MDSSQAPPSDPAPARFLPAKLEDLGAVFETLERGRSVLLGGPMESDPTPGVPLDAGPWLGVRTSGTTGQPGICWHRWEALKSGAVASSGYRDWRWASPFRADSFAGVQVGLQAWVTSGRAVSLEGSWSAQWTLLERLQPQALCATPTYLDLLGLSEGASRSSAPVWSPRQVTLGGEPLREAVGARLKARFPGARFTLIYAAAELGLIAKTGRMDGWFEAKDRVSGWLEWRVREGVLELLRDGKWFVTGDLAEERDGLMRILGRASALANVGGTKVQLARVEALAESVPGVRLARAVAEPNPITGQVVGLRYSLVPGAEAEAVRAALETCLRANLPKVAWPRVWDGTWSQLGPNGKKGT